CITHTHTHTQRADTHIHTHRDLYQMVSFAPSRWCCLSVSLTISLFFFSTPSYSLIPIILSLYLLIFVLPLSLSLFALSCGPGWRTCRRSCWRRCAPTRWTPCRSSSSSSSSSSRPRWRPLSTSEHVQETF